MERPAFFVVFDYYQHQPPSEGGHRAEIAKLFESTLRRCFVVVLVNWGRGFRF